VIRLFRVSIPTTIVFLVLGDTVLLAVAYLAGAYLGFNPDIDMSFYMLYQGGWIQMAFAVGMIQAGLYFQDWYDGSRPSRMLMLQQMSLVLGLAFLLQALLGYGQWELLQLPQWTMVYGSFFALVLLPAWHFSFDGVVRRAIPAQKLLFVGLSPVAREIVRRLRDRPEFGLAAAGYLAPQPEPDFDAAPYLGCYHELPEAVAKYAPQRVVVGLEPGNQLTHTLLDLRLSGVAIQPESALYETVFGRVATRNLRPSDLLFSADFQPNSFNMALQSVYSVALGAAGLVLALPLMAVLAALVKLTSPGPVLYRQKRVGLRGRTFDLYKFRSMYIDAEARTGPVWASRDDPRVTPVGRWLRRFRLDELPQFFNVVRGDMSLVGPRPERPEFCKVLEEKIPFYAQRHVVKPGVTGWAQINHSYADSFEDSIVKLEYDLYYIRNLAPSLDAYIVFHTLKVMLLSRGAR
jgi:exopolysaccharide biosynthesis polyprenyl glycosylphosphotransferase